MPSTSVPQVRLQRHKVRVDWNSIAFSVSLPLLAVVVALVIGAVLLVLLGANPFDAYGALIEGALGSVSGITQSLVKATPLLLVGLGICIAFRASVINIGAEGQIIMGAVMATWFSLQFRTWEGWLLIPLTMIMGFLAGAFWGFIPGVIEGALRRERDSEHRDDERHRAAIYELA